MNLNEDKPFYCCRSAFFFFCADERPALRKKFPDYSVGDIAKDLGRMWAVCKEKPKYDQLAAGDKKRYELVRKFNYF